MSRKYYYLAASLPMLDFQAKPPMTIREFLEECERLMDRPDFEEIQLSIASKVSKTTRPSQAKNPVAQQWLEFDRRFRNEIAWFRAVQQNKDPMNYIRGDRYIDPFMVDIVVEASKTFDPLTGERVLDRARWVKLSELEMGHYFDFEYLIVYGLKLKILERYQIIGSEKGRELFEKYQQIDMPEFEMV